MKLDNPVWHALNEIHANFALDYKGIKFYKPEYCPFGGFNNLESTAIGLNDYLKLCDNFFVVASKPNYGADLLLKNELVCNQMILNEPIDFNMAEEIIELKEDRLKDLIGLVNLVQPGYFKDNTPKLGKYFGIYCENKLVAVTGERMKMDDYTEISAVITHPDYVGKGYAKQLVSFVANLVFKENKIPFLHVAESNTGAIKLYEKLGFVTRRKISFWHFVRKETLSV